MYALVANGYSGIIRTLEELEVVSSLFPYPKFRKFDTEAECLIFLEQYRRNGSYSLNHKSLVQNGSLYVIYFIKDNKLFISIDTSSVGSLKIFKTGENLHIQECSSFINITITEFNFEDKLISSHCVAIDTIVRLVGNFVNVRIKVPDMSVYLACTKYTGTSPVIKSLIDRVANRLGTVDFEV